MFSQTYGQLDNSLFYDQYSIQDADSGAIKLGFDVSGYFWNNEYATDIAPGYTLFGYQFRPYISYYPSKNLRLDIGGFFMKDFGDSSFADIRPILTIKFHKNNFSFLFGSIEGAASHRLIEPLYYLQRVVNRRIEDGIQFKWENDKLFFDVWLEWVNMIRFGDDEQEVFNLGLSFNYQVYKSKKLIVEIPFQFLANHRGGEIDVNPLPAETFYNAALGFSLIFPFDNLDWLNNIRTDNYFADYFTTEDPVLLPYGQGQGFFLNVSSSFKWFDVMISYWNGNKFFAPQGTPIYQSISMDYMNNGYTEEQRKLLFLRFMYEHDFTGGLSLAFRFEPLYDFGNSNLDHMEVLFLRYKTDFLLNKRKR
jgi:hypothetical protein